MARVGVVLSLVALVAGGAAAQAADPQAVKNWFFQNYGNGSAEAWTVNDSGSQLGVLCSGKQSCLAYFVSQSERCEDGSQYPALMNAESGALPLTTICKQIPSADGKPRYVFVLNEFNAILGSMLKDHRLGIAVPQADGTFRVARFSLEGSNEALAAVNAAVGNGSKPASATGDQVL